MTTTTTTVQIASLLRDRRFQLRGKLDKSTIQRYAAVYRAGKEMPPIKVAKVNGAPVVVDGWHRLAALESIGRTEVEAEIVTATEKEARWLAAEANLSHGLPLKRRELREAFVAYVRAGKYRDKRGWPKSYRSIAEEFGSPHTTIRNWMKKGFPKIAQQYSDESYSKNPGGLPERQREEGFTTTARRHLQDALAASRGVTSPSDRFNLMELAKQVLAEIETGGPWEPPEPFDF